MISSYTIVNNIFKIANLYWYSPKGYSQRWWLFVLRSTTPRNPECWACGMEGGHLYLTLCLSLYSIIHPMSGCLIMTRFGQGVMEWAVFHLCKVDHSPLIHLCAMPPYCLAKAEVRWDVKISVDKYLKVRIISERMGKLMKHVCCLFVGQPTFFSGSALWPRLWRCFLFLTICKNSSGNSSPPQFLRTFIFSIPKTGFSSLMCSFSGGNFHWCNSAFLQCHILIVDHLH